MAFTITPTSGAAPYTLSADVLNYEAIDGVHYEATIGYSTSVGSCPATGAASYFAPVTVAAIVSGSPFVVSEVDIPAGSCRVYTLEIKSVSDNVVIASSSAFVDNV